MLPWNRARMLATVLRPKGGSVVAITYLLHDQFTTPDAAPVSSPRTCEPGPGTWTLVQTDGQMSIADGALVFPPQASIVWGDQGLFGGAVARAIGRCFMADVRFTGIGAGVDSGHLFGWRSNGALTLEVAQTVLNITGNANKTSVYNGSGGNIVVADALAVDTDYKLCVVARTLGGFMFVKIGANWTLLWVDATTNYANMYPAINNAGNAGKYDNLRVWDLPAPWTDDYGIATVSQATPVSGTGYTATADGIHDLTVTAPTPLANSAELRYRVTSDTNYWAAYLNNAGAFRLDSVANGSATNRINVAGVATQGNTYTIRAICDGTKHNCYTLSAATWTKRGSEVDLSHQDTATAVKPVAGEGWTLGALRSYPRRSTTYSTLDQT